MPDSVYGDTRKNMSQPHAFTLQEAFPVAAQAVRYAIWATGASHGLEEYALAESSAKNDRPLVLD